MKFGNLGESSHNDAIEYSRFFKEVLKYNTVIEITDKN